MGKQADEAEEGIEFGNPLADNSDEKSSSDSDEDLWTRDQRRRAAAKAAKAEAEADVTARAVTPVAKQAGDQGQGRKIALLAPEPEREPQPESLSASDVFEHEQAEEKLRQKAKKDAQKNAKLQERSEKQERKQAEREEKAVQRAKPTKLQQLKPTGAFETDLKPGMSKLEESWDGVSSDDGSQDEEGEKGNLEAMARFRELDATGTGSLNRKEAAELLQLLGKENDEEAVDGLLTEMWELGDQTGKIDEITMQEFLAWWSVHSAAQHGTMLGGFGNWMGNGEWKEKGLAKGIYKLKDKTKSLAKKGTAMAEEAAGLAEGEKSRGVPPESLFVIDKSGNADGRELAEVTIAIHEQFESDFHHLEDILVGGDEEAWLNTWEDAAMDKWVAQEEEEVVGQLNSEWTSECLEAAMQAIKLVPGAPPACYRGFVRAQIPVEVSYQGYAGKLRKKLDERLHKKTVPVTPSTARVKAKQFAQEQLEDGARKLEMLLNEETIPLEDAVSAVFSALETEVEAREQKVAALIAKRDAAGVDTPRKIRVSGLRGDAAEANGIYIADGLKSFWGRPFYVQMPEHHELSNLHYLFYDMRHDSADPFDAWTDGHWIIGPSLNSERCTAYYDESAAMTHTVKEGFTELMYPMPTDRIGPTALSKWMVFDVVSHEWKPAPGHHSPAFSVELVENEEENMVMYIDKSVQDQQQILDNFAEKLMSRTDPKVKEAIEAAEARAAKRAAAKEAKETAAKAAASLENIKGKKNGKTGDVENVPLLDSKDSGVEGDSEPETGKGKHDGDDGGDDEQQQEEAKEFIPIDESFEGTVRRAMSSHHQAIKKVSMLDSRLEFGERSEEMTINRRDFLKWRTSFYDEQLDSLRQGLRNGILSQRSGVHFPSGNDHEDNVDFVEDLLAGFVAGFEQKQQTRRMAKRRFLMTVNRPVLSRAFFSWKFACRSKSDGTDDKMSSGMFTEPTLPWNVRHPMSRFSALWETVQAILLVYIAYSVIWRLAFNVDATGVMVLVELSIDLYFTVDVILNFHTAYYNESGDLVGVKTSGGKTGEADLKALYWNYAKGWMVVDVLSVLPVDAVLYFASESGQDLTGKELKSLKSLRLFRLLKLLRLFRSMRVFKRHEDALGPVISTMILVGGVTLVLHTITCFWYFAGSERTDKGTLDEREQSGLRVDHNANGWVEAVFELTEKHCACHEEYHVGMGIGHDLYFDSFEGMCVNSTDEDALLLKPCEDAEHQIPNPWDYYSKAMFTAMQDPSVGEADSYTPSMLEMIMATVATALIGFVWGAVAGAWSTIFAANQMASQAYKMKMREVREFCKIKQLDWGIRAKLTAHYEHLYPEEVIINEGSIMNDLPPRLREALIRELYGQVVSSVPIFFGLETPVLTELCLNLKPVPALQGEIVQRQGAAGNEMYIISNGACRVTVRQHIGDDTERARQWITQVFASANKPVKLYEPNQKLVLEELLKKIKKIRKRKKRNYDAQKAGREAMMKTLDTAQSVDVLNEQQQRKLDRREEKAATRVTYKDIMDDDDIDKQLQDSNSNLEELLNVLKKKGLIKFEGILSLNAEEKKSHLSRFDMLAKGDQDRFESAFFSGKQLNEDGQGPEITLTKNVVVEGDSSIVLFCNALRNGSVLCDLVNFFLPPKQRIDVWRPSLMDIMVAESLALTSDLVDGAMEMAGEMAEQAEAIAREAAEQAELQAHKAMEKSKQLAEEAAKRAAEEAVKRGGEAAQKAMDAMKDAMEEAQKQMDRAREMAEEAARKAQEEAEKRSGISVEDIQRRAHEAMEEMEKMAHEAAGEGMAGVDGMGGIQGLGTENLYELMGGGPSENAKRLRRALLDRDNDIFMQVEHVLFEDDLLTFDQGTEQEQDEKQSRVLNCVIEFAYSVMNMEGYSGPLLDEVDLGNLSQGEFFGELALLPFTGGWRHKRTTTALKNSILYSLSKPSVEMLSLRFPTLKNQLIDHAEDYEKVTAVKTARAGLSAAVREAKMKNKGGSMESSGENDPMSMLQEQLKQQDGKISEIDRQLSEQAQTMQQLLGLVKKLVPDDGARSERRAASRDKAATSRAEAAASRATQRDKQRATHAASAARTARSTSARRKA